MEDSLGVDWAHLWTLRVCLLRNMPISFKNEVSRAFCGGLSTSSTF